MGVVTSHQASILWALYGHCRSSRKHPPASWDAFSDVDAFVDEVLSELAAMATDGTRPTRPGLKAALAGAALRKGIMGLWCVCFCGMQWRAIG